MLKDHKEGMEAGARPFEEKFKKQEQALNRVANRLEQKVDILGGGVNMLADTMNSFERKEIYDLNTPFDLKNLEEKEYKEVLLAGLYTLSARSNNPTEYQQTFVRSVQNYLELPRPQTAINLATIESIENIPVQKAIMQVFMEYLFLENENDSFLCTYQDIFEHFSVNAKGRDEILTHIKNIYSAVGVQGIAEKYGFVPEQLKNTGITEQYISSEIDDYIIEKPLVIFEGEEKQFENKRIVIKVSITVSGMAIFKNCTIDFDTLHAIAISVKKGEVLFENCMFQSTKSCTRAEILCEDAKISINASKLVGYAAHNAATGTNAACFLLLKNTKCSIRSSLFDYCEGNIIESAKDDEQYVSNVSIVDTGIYKHCGSFIEGWHIALELGNVSFQDMTAQNNTASIIKKLYSLKMRKCTYSIEEQPAYIPRLCSEGIMSDTIIDNCEFRNILIENDKPMIDITLMALLTISNCRFQDTTGINLQLLKNVTKVAKFEANTFDRCRGTIISGNNLIINNCTFMRCENRTEDFFFHEKGTKGFSSQDFNLSFLGKSDSLIFIHTGDTSQTSLVEDCNFFECTSSGALIKIRMNDEKIKKINDVKLVNLKNCTSKGCNAEKKSIECVQANSFGFDKNVHCYSIINGFNYYYKKGIESIWKEITKLVHEYLPKFFDAQHDFMKTFILFNDTAKIDPKIIDELKNKLAIRITSNGIIAIYSNPGTEIVFTIDGIYFSRKLLFGKNQWQDNPCFLRYVDVVKMYYLFSKDNDYCSATLQFEKSGSRSINLVEGFIDKRVFEEFMYKAKDLSKQEFVPSVVLQKGTATFASADIKIKPIEWEGDALEFFDYVSDNIKKYLDTLSSDEQLDKGADYSEFLECSEIIFDDFVSAEEIRRAVIASDSIPLFLRNKPWRKYIIENKTALGSSLGDMVDSEDSREFIKFTMEYLRVHPEIANTWRKEAMASDNLRLFLKNRPWRKYMKTTTDT